MNGHAQPADGPFLADFPFPPIRFKAERTSGCKAELKKPATSLKR
ncbi:hypothetical protein PO124_29345 [Bacillus licheniformis]|nr:hypothetical protein [Bacillus licheniformis]